VFWIASEINEQSMNMQITVSYIVTAQLKNIWNDETGIKESGSIWARFSVIFIGYQLRQRTVFRTAVLAYKCQHGMAPEYLQVYCQPTSTVACRRLRSVDSGRLAVPRTRTSYGECSFAVQGPRSWNSLPAELRRSDMFRHKLKTFLF